MLLRVTYTGLGKRCHILKLERGGRDCPCGVEGGFVAPRFLAPGKLTLTPTNSRLATLREALILRRRECQINSA